MAIALRKEVVDRLLMTKSLLSRIRGDPSAEPDRYAVAEQILISQDAAELALGAIADQLGKLPQKGKYYLMDYFDSLREAHPEKNVEGKEFLRQLNEARIGIKDIGNFPDPKQWARVGERILSAFQSGVLNTWAFPWMISMNQRSSKASRSRRTSTRPKQL